MRKPLGGFIAGNSWGGKNGSRAWALRYTLPRRSNNGKLRLKPERGSEESPGRPMSKIRSAPSSKRKGSRARSTAEARSRSRRRGGPVFRLRLSAAFTNIFDVVGG